MSGCSRLTRRRFRRDPTHALFADQSQSIPDNLVALLGPIRAWNYSAETAQSAAAFAADDLKTVTQLGAMFGVGRCGGIEKTSLISLTSEERRTRPHMRASIAPRGRGPKRLAVAPVVILAENA